MDADPVGEEVEHAMKFFDHINERGGRGELLSLAQPAKEWLSPLEAFKAADAHEQFITGRINELMKIAADEQAHTASILLQWLVTEQVEGEASTSHIVDMLERIGDSRHGLLLLDRELGTRTGD